MVVRKLDIGMGSSVEGAVDKDVGVEAGANLSEESGIDWVLAVVAEVLAVDEWNLRRDSVAAMELVSGLQSRHCWVGSPWHRLTALDPDDRACQSSKGP